jgi:uncharacterized repeat protein (TIGR03803 family)
VTLLVTSAWASTHWQEKVLHNFGSGTDGVYPHAGVIFDAIGNLYGTTPYGGTYGYGTVFELSPAPGGGWTETVLYSFNNNGTDRVSPEAGLIFDAAGKLYGTTFADGAGLIPIFMTSLAATMEDIPTASWLWTRTAISTARRLTSASTVMEWSGKSRPKFPRWQAILIVCYLTAM